MTAMGEILEFTYEDEMKTSFRDYAVSVIVGRALPDVRDGFKPVHRRIMYAMKELNILPHTAYKKSARITGEIIGKYHPHGDAAVYEAMVKLSQDFGQTIPLVDGHGNFGSIDGDSPAAMRYTEVRLSSSAMYLLNDLEKNIVDFRENYDGTEKEPVVLPAKFPNLLINGTFGIAVGMQSNIPPHNVGEVIDAFLRYTKRPKATIEDLLEILPAPDFPTGGIIINKEEVKDLYRKGEGRVVIRSKIEIEPAPYGKTNVVITEIPFTIAGGKSKFVNDLTKMVVEKKLNEVTDVRDESSKDGIRIVLEVKKGVNIDKFLTKLYSRTKVQDSASYRFLALVDGKPTTLPLMDYFHHYLEFQKEITRRKYEYLYDKGLARKEILDGLIEAIDKIDAIVEAIRGSKTVAQMKKCLIEGETEGIQFKLKKNKKIARSFSFTERQAKSILDMKLQRLGALEVEALQKEYDKLLKDLESYQKILNNENALIREIRKEHEKFKKEFATPRKTKVEEIKTKKYVEEKRVEDVLILVDRFGYAKTMDSPNKNTRLKEFEKSYKYVLPTKSNDRLIAITNRGTLYQIKLENVPKGKLRDKGVTIQAIAGLERGEHPVYITTKNNLEKETLFFVTKQGLTKRTEGKDLVSTRLKVIGTKLNKKDELLFVGTVNSDEQIALFQTKRGYIAKIKADAFSVMNKNAKGVTSLSLKESDQLENIYLLHKDEEKELSVNGKMIEISQLPISRRGVVGKLIR